MPVPDYSDPAPVYQQIAGDLRDLISTGTYAPGSRLPANKALSAQYGVADGTLRTALGVLRSEGLVISQSTRGTYVVRKPAGRAGQLDVKELATQVAGLRKAVTKLEAHVATLYDYLGKEMDDHEDQAK